MAHVGQSTGSSATAQTLSVDFNCIADVKIASNWNRETLFFYLSRISNEEEDEKGLLRAVEIPTTFDYNGDIRIFSEASRRGEPPVPASKTFSWDTVTVNFHSVFDILGYIISTIINKQKLPRERPECLLLLALYSKWCHTLGGRKGNFPNRVYIAYDLYFETSIYLGVNIGGAGKLKQAIQGERFQWLKETGCLDLGDDAGASPMALENGQRFGHCSETIPLTVKMLNCNLSRRNTVQGICMCAHKHCLEEVYEPALLEKLIQGACLNCEEIIRQFGGDTKNFSVPAVTAA